MSNFKTIIIMPNLKHTVTLSLISILRAGESRARSIRSVALVTKGITLQPLPPRREAVAMTTDIMQQSMKAPFRYLKKKRKKEVIFHSCLITEFLDSLIVTEREEASWLRVGCVCEGVGLSPVPTPMQN